MTAPLRLTVRRSQVTAPSGLGAEISLKLPSEVVWIEEAVELIARHCLAGHKSSNRFRFRLRVALSEALANAIICGNGEDPTKQVHIRVECLVEQVHLHVTDQGSGFNTQQIPKPVRPDDLENACGRGLFLIHNLMDQVRFNDRGNSICMTLRRH
jgi:serine/threonine-protein kinase RsbW